MIVALWFLVTFWFLLAASKPAPDGPTVEEPALSGIKHNTELLTTWPSWDSSSFAPGSNFGPQPQPGFSNDPSTFFEDEWVEQQSGQVEAREKTGFVNQPTFNSPAQPLENSLNAGIGGWSENPQLSNQLVPGYNSAPFTNPFLFEDAIGLNVNALGNPLWGNSLDDGAGGFLSLLAGNPLFGPGDIFGAGFPGFGPWFGQGFGGQLGHQLLTPVPMQPAPPGPVPVAAPVSVPSPVPVQVPRALPRPQIPGVPSPQWRNNQAATRQPQVFSRPVVARGRARSRAAPVTPGDRKPMNRLIRRDPYDIIAEDLAKWADKYREWDSSRVVKSVYQELNDGNEDRIDWTQPSSSRERIHQRPVAQFNQDFYENSNWQQQSHRQLRPSVNSAHGRAPAPHQ